MPKKNRREREGAAAEEVKKERGGGKAKQINKNVGNAHCQRVLGGRCSDRTIQGRLRWGFIFQESAGGRRNRLRYSKSPTNRTAAAY